MKDYFQLLKQCDDEIAKSHEAFATSQDSIFCGVWHFDWVVEKEILTEEVMELGRS